MVEMTRPKIGMGPSQRSGGFGFVPIITVEDVDEPEEIEVCEQVHEVQVTTAKTYAQSLQEEIDLETAPKSYDNSLQSKKSLQTEMSLFESTNQRGESLAFLHLTLKNISPTSVACEQGFSLAGNIITRSRARLTFLSN